MVVFVVKSGVGVSGGALSYKSLGYKVTPMGADTTHHPLRILVLPPGTSPVQFLLTFV